VWIAGGSSYPRSVFEQQLRAVGAVIPAPAD
jgi:hypothetical protein